MELSARRCRAGAGQRVLTCLKPAGLTPTCFQDQIVPTSGVASRLIFADAMRRVKLDTQWGDDLPHSCRRLSPHGSRNGFILGCDPNLNAMIRRNRAFLSQERAPDGYCCCSQQQIASDVYSDCNGLQCHCSADLNRTCDTMHHRLLHHQSDQRLGVLHHNDVQSNSK